MRTRSRFRAWWSRLTLASKLTISYLAPLLVIALADAIAAAFIVTLQIGQVGEASAERAVDSLTGAVERIVERQRSAEGGWEANPGAPDAVVRDAFDAALSSAEASTLAAAVLDAAGNVIAGSSEWPQWSERARTITSAGTSGATQISRTFGRHRLYLAWQTAPGMDVAIGVVYDADHLESLMGRIFVLFVSSAALAMITIPVLSKLSAVFITAPVNRTTRHLVNAAGSPTRPLPGDELGHLVRHLLRTSVRLDYEQQHREQAEEELGITATVYRNIGEGIIVLDPQGTVSRVNPAFTRITGYVTADLRGQTPAVLIPPEHRDEHFAGIAAELETHGEWQGEIVGVRKTGERLPILLSVRAVYGPDEERRGYIAVVRDISDIRSTQDRLQHLASHDPLTDLPNRTYLSESLKRVLQTRERRGGTAAAIFVDVDHFKDVNDSHGHHAGDELLQIIASRLRAVFRAEDIISRFGGDEFVIVITEIDRVSAVDEIVRRMLNRIREPARVEGIPVRPSATAGIAIYPDSGRTAEDLLKNADAAMYEAKRIGRGSYRYHDPGMNESLRVRLAVQDRVRRGLRTEEFVLYWQPVFAVEDLRMVGAEALIRWRHEEAICAPAEFMPQIEGSQVMLELGDWVINDTVETLAVNESVLPVSFRVAVNVSAVEIIQRDFAQSVLEALSRHSVAPSRLGIEVTEGAVVRDVPMAQRAIRELQANGVRVYLDDFGVGYSSLQYLREFGVDAVKLDKSFLTEVPASISACSLVRGFIDLAHGLGLRTTIEGVERPEQVQYLRSVGCDTMQGFHPGGPMPAEDLIRSISGTAAT